jgi:hypothetical protein
VPSMLRSVKVGVSAGPPLVVVTSFDLMLIFTCTSRFGKTCGVNSSVSPVFSY